MRETDRPRTKRSSAGACARSRLEVLAIGRSALIGREDATGAVPCGPERHVDQPLRVAAAACATLRTSSAYSVNDRLY